MAVRPDEAMALGRLSGLYRRNIDAMGNEDVLVTSCGGAGQSLIGNILFELGLNYADAYTETLCADGGTERADGHAGYRDRLASLHDKDDGAGRAPVRVWPRFVKSHHPPEVFPPGRFGRVWLLVRDPRDALYTMYRWRESFGEEPWDLVPDTFDGWLSGPGDYSESPVRDWPAFDRSWRARCAAEDIPLTVVRFEDLKLRPVETMRELLATAGVSVDEATARAAVAASTFERMREHEDSVAADGAPRMMRSGAVAGWSGWMTARLWRHFDDDELRRAASPYGYDLSTPTGLGSAE